MTEHEELQYEIPGYVAGRLPEQERQRLELHLAECLACQELCECCEALARELRREKDPGSAEHPEPALLEVFGAGLVRDESIARHVETCMSCALEASLPAKRTPVRIEPTPSSARARFFRPFLAGSLAGAAACAALVLLLHAGRGEPFSANVQAGRAPLLLLEEAPRNGTPASSVPVASDQPFIPLGVRVNLPPAVSDADRFVFTIRAAGASPCWSSELSVAQIRAEQSRAWVVGFLLPASGRAPGSYLLRVAQVGRDGAPLMEVPFEIVR